MCSLDSARVTSLTFNCESIKKEEEVFAQHHRLRRYLVFVDDFYNTAVGCEINWQNDNPQIDR